MTDKQNPYEVYGVHGSLDPVLVSVSGGRSSGYMLKHILDAYDGQPPANVHFVFQNTGRERPETIRFLQNMELHWGVRITMIERDFSEDGDGFRFVGGNHGPISMNGEPFEELIDRKQMLPNGLMRFCTIELKIRAGANYMRWLGYDRWCVVVGFRADESERTENAAARDLQKKDPWYTLAPMDEAGVTKRDVVAWWEQQPFDLELLSVNGKTPGGNCDGCMLKSQEILKGLARDEPERMAWWVAQEARALGKANENTATFRNPSRLTHTQIAALAARQVDWIASAQAEGKDCFCAD